MLIFNMSSILVKTKLFVPHLRTKLVERARLLDILSQGFQDHHRLLLINAPAGFGKTTLVRAWIETIHSPTAWFTIETGDARPRQFLNYLTNAICQALPELEETLLPVTTANPPLPNNVILTLLVNQVSESKESLVIVLDDYHNIESPEMDEVLTFLLDHLPASTTMVLTTRVTPDFPHTRQMTEITMQDLRFTSAETEDFFEINFGLHLNDDVLSYLKRITEGWAAGLQLLTYLSGVHPNQMSPTNDLGNIDTLSQREMDVLKLISEGLTNQEIAQKLFLSNNTIKSHSIKIYRKLNVKNRSQAVSKARLLGILPSQQPQGYPQDYGQMRP